MPGLAILLSKKKPAGIDKSKDEGSPEEESQESPDKEHSEEDTKHAVMNALIKAIHEKDVEGALQAFEDLAGLCKEGSNE